jgi:hypothetical protein
MSDSSRDRAKPIPDAAKPAQKLEDDDRMEDEEKILAGRDDANVPAMLTKDVPGG